MRKNVPSCSRWSPEIRNANCRMCRMSRSCRAFHGSNTISKNSGERTRRNSRNSTRSLPSDLMVGDGWEPRGIWRNSGECSELRRRLGVVLRIQQPQSAVSRTSFRRVRPQDRRRFSQASAAQRSYRSHLPRVTENESITVRGIPGSNASALPFTISGFKNADPINRRSATFSTVRNPFTVASPTFTRRSARRLALRMCD